MANDALKDHALEAQSDTMDGAAKATSSVVQAILTNMQSGGHSPRSTRAAELESFDRSWDKYEQFI